MISDRVSEVLRLLINCTQSESGPTVEKLRRLHRRRSNAIAMSPELKALPDDTIISGQDLIDIFYDSIKHAEKIAEVEARYHEGAPIAQQGAKA